jgi:hypothetical protein
MRPGITRPLSVGILCALLLGGCGDDDDPLEAVGTGAGSSTTTRVGGNQAVTTTTDAPADTVPEPGGEPFSDPDGSYEIEIDPEWERDDARADPGIEFWLVAKEFDGFFPNVNLLTQTVPSGLGLEEYVDLSIDGIDDYIDEADVIDERTVEGADGQELALLEYTGEVEGLPLHFLQLVTVDGDEAVVATYTAPDRRFDELRPDIEPYLYTLRSS